MSVKNFKINMVAAFMALLILPSTICFSAPSNEGNDLMMGIPFGGVDDQAYMDVCPQGTRVVYAFLDAWSKKDYKTMYYLIDEGSKQDYSFDEARYDFEFMEYKEYAISSARQQGNDYEFILSHGDWKYGDKDIKKVLISGSSFKIVMPSRGMLFKKSADSYF